MEFLKEKIEASNMLQLEITYKEYVDSFQEFESNIRKFIHSEASEFEFDINIGDEDLLIKLERTSDGGASFQLRINGEFKGNVADVKTLSQTLERIYEPF